MFNACLSNLKWITSFIKQEKKVNLPLFVILLHFIRHMLEMILKYFICLLHLPAANEQYMTFLI